MTDNSVYTTRVRITPDAARNILAEKNTNNRGVRRRHIQRLARDMAAGRWLTTGESLKFATDGTLLDGQHRLAAVVAADVAIDFDVTYNVDPAAQTVMDSGVSRTASDAAGLLGIKNRSIVTSAARLAIALELASADSLNKTAVSTQEQLAWIAANPDIHEAADFASGARDHVDCVPSVIAYSLWRFMQVDRDAAWAFWQSVKEPVGLLADNPVFVLNRRLAQARRNNEHMRPDAYLSLVFRTWNYWRRGQTIERIQLTSRYGGIIPIPVPE